MPGAVARRARLARGALDRAADGARLVLTPARVAASPRRVLRPARAGAHGGAHAAAAGAGLLAERWRARARAGTCGVSRSLDDLRAVRRRFGVTPNDVVLAACAGGLRRFAERRGEPPRRLKAMVPADVRTAEDDAGSGNRITFVFLELPCDEPDSGRAAGGDQRGDRQRRRDGDAEDDGRRVRR